MKCVEDQQILPGVYDHLNQILRVKSIRSESIGLNCVSQKSRLDQFEPGMSMNRNFKSKTSIESGPNIGRAKNKDRDLRNDSVKYGVMINCSNAMVQLMDCLHKDKSICIRVVNKGVNKGYKQTSILHEVSCLGYFIDYLH